MTRRLFLLTCLIAFLFLSLSACSSTKNRPVLPLRVSFTESEWDGIAVPVSGQCRKCGGEGISPGLLVQRIPEGANYVIVEFNDRTYEPLSSGGGHGAYRVKVPEGATEVTIPSVKENRDNLPRGVFAHKSHRAVGYGKGVYLGPCGCGYGNAYFAVVKAAVMKYRDQEPEVLARATIELGRF